MIVGLYYDHIGFESEPRFISSGGSDMGYPTTFEISQKTKHAQPLEIHQKTNCIFDMSSHGIDVNLATLAKSQVLQNYKLHKDLNYAVAFFDDISFSRTNSNGTYRYEK